MNIETPQIREVGTTIPTSAPAKTAAKASASTKYHQLITTAPATQQAGVEKLKLYRPVLGEVPSFDASRAGIIFAQLRTKLLNEVITATEGDIKTNMKKMKQQNQKIIDKLDKIVKEKEKAAKRSLISKIFGWIGNILGLIVGVVATVLTGGAGVAMVVASVIGITTSILSETGTMQKWMSAMTTAFTKLMVKNGMSEDKAKKIAGVLSQVVVATVILAVTITAAIVSGGAAMKQALSSIKDVIMRNVVRFGNAAASISGMGSGAAQVSQGVSQYEMLKASSDKTDIETAIKSTQFMINSDVNLVAALTKSISGFSSTVSDLLSSSLESRAQTVKSLV